MLSFNLILIDTNLIFTFKVDCKGGGLLHNYEEDQVAKIAFYQED